jgi:hypothetical protein
LQADNSVRVLLAESDVRDKKINELAAKLHSAEQQQKAAMQTVHLFVCFVAILVSDCCVSLTVHFISGKHDASALGNGISAKRGKINPAAVISVLLLVSYLYFTKEYYN